MSPEHAIVQLSPIGPLADAQLRTQYGAVALWEQPAQWRLQHADAVQMLVTSVRHGCDAQTLSQFPQLKAVCSWGVGYDTIDTAAAHGLGIQVSHTPGVLDACVADMAWALLLAAARRVAEADRYVRAGQWRRLGEFPLGMRVAGKRLGLIGMGRIGQAIARRGQGFDMQIAYHARSHRPDVPYVHQASLLELAAWADFLVVACVGGPSTHHLVDAHVLRALGPQGILVNIARGSVVDQQALISSLQQHTIAAAGLDVLQGEPGAPELLRSLDNVVLTPHMGSATVDTRRDMEQCVLDNVAHFWKTGQVLHPVQAH